jgi:2-polyprenyl-3-methyl-5-hydroxy-6-metoxy-1,4-benzoquinol methylase
MGEKYAKDYFNELSTKSSNLFDFYWQVLGRAGVTLGGKKFCDIGCAEGVSLQAIVDNNTCYGIDISAHAISQCQQKYPTISDNFIQCDLNLARPDISEVFDVITMFDVLEHLDSYRFLREFLNINLRPGGYFLVTTPNSNSALRFINHEKFNGEIDPTHLALFTPYTLDFLLRRLDFQKREMLTPYSFHFKDDVLTRNILLGGQIVAIYQKLSI